MRTGIDPSGPGTFRFSTFATGSPSPAVAASATIAARASSTEPASNGGIIADRVSITIRTCGSSGMGTSSSGAPRHAAEQRQGHAVVDAFERHLDRHPEPEPGRRDVAEKRREPDVRVVELDERRDERHAVLVAGKERAVDGHPGEDGAASADRRPR